MTTKTKKKRARAVTPARSSQKTAPARRLPRRGLALVAVLGFAALSGTLVLLQRSDGTPAPPAAGLPRASDYHSLLVAPGDSSRLLLGTHQGLYSSGNGGRTWRAEGLGGQDAMNLARPTGPVVWAAGHELLAKSVDGGRTWQNVRPSGLAGLDLHGFAVDPRRSTTLYAVVAGRGLYRSVDGGRSFELVSSDVGPAVMALAVTPSTILAGDMQRGLLGSGDGGRTWRLLVQAQVMGLSVNLRDPKRVLATGPGILLSTDGGVQWRQVLDVAGGAGPVAWSAGDPKLAYAVGFDRVLYRTADAGLSWRPVG